MPFGAEGCHHLIIAGFPLVCDAGGDLLGGLALQDASDGKLCRPLVVVGEVSTAESQGFQGDVHLIEGIIEVGGDLPALVDLHGVGVGVGHGVPVVDLFSIGAGVGALLPPVCRLSDWHSLAGVRLAVASELPSLATLADRLAPVAALGLGAMHQEGERFSTETVAVVVINLQPQAGGIIIGHHHFAIASEQTFVDHVVELATVGCSQIEIGRQVSYTKLGEDVQGFAIAIELEIGVHLCNLHPCFKISEAEEVARLMNANQLGVASLEVLQCNVNLIGSVINTHLQVVYNGLQVVCSVVECPIVLHLRRCSEATELGVLGVLNATLAVCINNSKGLAEHSTWAGLACGQVEDQGLGAQLGVAFGEGEHGSVVG